LLHLNSALANSPLFTGFTHRNALAFGLHMPAAFAASLEQSVIGWRLGAAEEKSALGARRAFSGYRAKNKVGFFASPFGDSGDGRH
jgi:hypothetical protein